MRKFPTSIWALCLLVSIGANIDRAGAENAAPTIDKLPQDLEIQLALTALPAQLRGGATVYVLNPAIGFEVARKGTNGFYALVARTGDDAMQGTWSLTAYPKDVLYPLSFDSAGAKANMQVFLDIAKMQAGGTPPEELKKLIQERYRSGYYKAPDRAGCSYMLSPILRTYVNPDLATRPIFHKTDAGIRGHVFCTFLALVLRKELMDRLAARRSHAVEWQRIIDDLSDLSEIEIEQDGRRALLRTAPGPTIDPVCRAVGMTLPPVFQEMPSPS